MADIQAVTKAMFKARDAHDVEALAGMVSDDFKYTEHSQGLVNMNKADWQAHLSKMFATVSDDKMTLRSVKGRPELFNAEMTGTIKMERDGQAFSGQIDGVFICALNSEGKYTEVTAYTVFTPK